MSTPKGERFINDLRQSKEVTFYAIYIGSIAVERSMRTMQYEFRTSLTKEAIVKVCSAGAGKQDFKRPKAIKQINKILPRPPQINKIGVNFSVSLTGLKAEAADSQKLVVGHSMSAISFASCGEMPFKSYVGYVAKDHTRGRACHVFNCFDDAADVVSTIGEAFSVKYEDVLTKHSQNRTPFEFITLEEGFCRSIFDDCENTAQNNQNGDCGLYENLPLTTSTAPPFSLLPRKVSNSTFYLPTPEWPTSSPCPAKSGPKKEAESTPTAQGSPAPVKPPRPKVPVYANIDDVDRKTKGAASDSSPQTSVSPESASRVTELRKNLEDLECSLNEISANIGDSCQQMSWFHGKICREEAERRLKFQGDYLVRSHGNGQFVLSCLDNGYARHLLLVDPHGQIRTKDRHFRSITDLVSHYSSSGECIVSEGCALRITRAVPHNSAYH